MMTWPWTVAGYYADDVAPPKEPGGLAHQVNVAGEQLAALEVAIFRRRSDIGEIVCTPPLSEQGQRLADIYAEEARR